MGKVKSALIFLAAIFLVAAPMTAQAHSRGASTSLLNPGEIHDGDYYAGAGTTQVSGTVNGDVYAAGGTVIVDGTVNGDVLAAGGTVTVSGTVSGNVREAGGNLIIDGEVDRNLTAAGGTVQIGSRAKIKGNVLAAGGTVTMNGPIEGNLTVAAGTLTLDGPVTGNVTSRVGRLMAGSNAKVSGSLEYTSQNNATIDSGASFGKVSHKYPPEQRKSNPWLFHLLKLLAFLATGLAAIWLISRFVGDSSETLARRPWQSLGIGFAAGVLVPVVAFILFITLIGIPLGMILIGLDAFGLVIAQVVFALWIGRRVGAGTKWWTGDYWGFVAGAVVYWAVSLIPVLGGIVVAVATLLGFGAVMQTLFSRRKQL